MKMFHMKHLMIDLGGAKHKNEARIKRDFAKPHQVHKLKST